MKRDRFAVELPTEDGGREGEGQGHDEAQEGLEVVEAEAEIEDQYTTWVKQLELKLFELKAINKCR